MKLDQAIEDVQAAEALLARELLAVGERHAAEHDVYHLSHILAKQCARHIERLAPFAERYSASYGEDGVAGSTTVLETARRERTELLHDLRDLYLTAQAAEIAWVILSQAAKAARERELLEAVGPCHEEAELRGKWLRTRIKETAPQVLATGAAPRGG